MAQRHHGPGPGKEVGDKHTAGDDHGQQRRAVDRTAIDGVGLAGLYADAGEFARVVGAIADQVADGRPEAAPQRGAIGVGEQTADHGQADPAEDGREDQAEAEQT